ncbi:hypothetical protein HYPSUDRAFT_199403 [Hypholoma sublateritium FD-334 SS-4]|uniref:Uncharacterized protein n=1 Tax=Hypholoma sublateritium (strain FD-334 SS-4) TaxID=945553 RepID=A0A0D2Q2B6_HYPSF|nr:hypothetical protein HYPSUDRAFT_199403 [Hypholoma sublateritium FD-334 SS-4]
MDADIDWCLSCNRRVPHGLLYCSPACRPAPAHARQEPTASATHSWRAAPDDRAAIHAWAAAVPPGPPPPADAPPPVPAGSPAPPNLVRPPRRAVPPSLSMTTPAATAAAPHHHPASLPLPAPRRPPSSASLALSGCASAGQTSRCTPATESSLATPPPHAHAHPTPLLASSRRPSVIGGIFRGWAAPPAPTPKCDPPTETLSFPARGRRASRAAA